MGTKPQNHDHRAFRFEPEVEAEPLEVRVERCPAALPSSDCVRVWVGKQVLFTLWGNGYYANNVERVVKHLGLWQ